MASGQPAAAHERPVSLEALLRSEPAAVQAMVQALAAQGWLFVSLPPELAKPVLAAEQPLAGFFARPAEEKLRHSENVLGTEDTDGPVYGYNSSGRRKEGLRWLTGSRFREAWIPAELRDQAGLAAKVHSMLQVICGALATSALGLSPEQCGSRFNIPLLAPVRPDVPPARCAPPVPATGERFAMFDVAHYLNEAVPKNGLNCASHHDPGLLSLSLLSTQPGLQLRRADGSWVDGPVRLQMPGCGEPLAVLWAGELASIASGGKLQPGVHRVISPYSFPAPPRLSMWIEAVTVMQDVARSAPLLAALPAAGFELGGAFEEPSAAAPAAAPLKKQPLKFRQDGVGKMFGLPKVSLAPMAAPSAPAEPLTRLVLQPGQSVEAALREASDALGVPMTKMITYYCPFCLDPVPDLKGHVEAKHANAIERPGEQPRAQAPRAAAPRLRAGKNLKQREPLLKVPVEPGQSVEEALMKASTAFGIPMTKAIRYYCPLCLQMVGNLTRHVQEDHPGDVFEHRGTDLSLEPRGPAAEGMDVDAEGV